MHYTGHQDLSGATVEYTFALDDKAGQLTPSIEDQLLVVVQGTIMIIAMAGSSYLVTKGISEGSTTVEHTVSYGGQKVSFTVGATMTIQRAGLEKDAFALLGHGLTELHALRDIIDKLVNQKSSPTDALGLTALLDLMVSDDDSIRSLLLNPMMGSTSRSQRNWASTFGQNRPRSDSYGFPSGMRSSDS